MNNRHGGDLVKERLDRALCNLDWCLTFPEAVVFALPTVGSNHSPLLLHTEVQQTRRSKPFVFEAYWLQHPECRNIVTTAWDSAKRAGNNLPHKLRIVSAVLHRWSQAQFSNARSHISRLQ